MAIPATAATVRVPLSDAFADPVPGVRPTVTLSVADVTRFPAPSRTLTATPGRVSPAGVVTGWTSKASWVATAAELDGVSGRYFANCKEARTNPLAGDRNLGDRLWKVSEELTGLA